MKKILFGVMLAFAAVGCSKNQDLVGESINEELVDVTLSMSVDNPQTKGSGANFGVNSDDNTLNTMDLFVFRTKEGSDDYGALEYYKRFSADECSTSFNFLLKLTTGPKTIVSIGNSHRSSWPNITRLDALKAEISSLQNEQFKNFTMTGVLDLNVNGNTTVQYNISRLVSRIVVANISTKFEGTPYEGYPFKNVKMYLINVQGQKYFVTNSGQNLKVLNYGRVVDTDINGCAIAGMLYDNAGVDITDSGYSTKHYFYCYQNDVTQENDNNKFTKLVIEGEINGVTYYYPIPLKELERNNSYSYDITILKPGSLDPAKDVTNAQISTVCMVSNWNEKPLYKVEF